MRTALLVLVASSCLPLAVACDSDGGDSVPAECSVALSPGSAAFDALQTAFIEAQSGDVICLKAGTYSLTRELSLSNARDIEIRGIGATRDDVVLDFAGQTVGDDGMTVTADGFIISNLTIKNTPGNGIVVHADTSRFTNIKVSWDAGSVVDNGAYAIYPNDCTRTIIEDSEVVGAADAGIYVGSCEFAIVRRNKVYANVAGIEIENSRYADVYENEAYDNTAGIMVFVLPNLKIKEARNVLVRDNVVYDNNRENFAEDGTVVSYVPQGLGVLVMGAKDVEIRGNELNDNDATAIALVSYSIMELLAGVDNDDPDMDPYVERVYIHGNTYTNNGTTPVGAMFAIAAGAGGPPLEDILWDGDVRSAGYDAQICLGASADGSFRNLETNETDTASHSCTLTGLPTMSTFDDMVAP